MIWTKIMIAEQSIDKWKKKEKKKKGKTNIDTWEKRKKKSVARAEKLK